MAAAFQAAGTFVAGARLSTSTPTWPTHNVNDIALLFVTSEGSETINLTTANGFVQITNSPQSTGSLRTDSQLAVYWCRASSTSMSAPVVAAGTTDTIYSGILTYRGCITSGNPWDVTAGSAKAPASTTATLPSVTTTVPNTLVVLPISSDLDITTPWTTSMTNAGLANLTERFDLGTNVGGGGAIAVYDGQRAATGAIGTTAWSGTNSINAFMTIALKSAVKGLSFCPGFLY